MRRPTPRSTRTDTLSPYTALFRSHHEVTLGLGTIHLVEAAARLAQGFQHLVDVGIGHNGHRAADLEPGHVDGREFRHDLERRGVGDFAILRPAGGVDRRIRDRLQLLLRHGLAQRAADQVGQHFTTNLLAETLLDHCGRHLARAEALQANGTTHFRNPRTDLRLEPLRGKFHRELALERADVLNRNLHDVSWYYLMLWACHRRHGGRAA